MEPGSVVAMVASSVDLTVGMSDLKKVVMWAALMGFLKVAALVYR